MANNFSDLYPFIRGIVGDYGKFDDSGDLIANTYVLHNNVLESIISLFLLETADYSEAGAAGSKTISPTLVDDAKGWIAYSVAFILICPKNLLGYSTPIGLQIRRGEDQKLLHHIVDKMLFFAARLAGNTGGEVYAQDSAIKAYYEGATRWEAYQALIDTLS